MKDLNKQFNKALELLKRYNLIVFIIIFGLMYGFIITTSTKNADRQVYESDLKDKYESTSSPKLDETVAKRLEELEEQNIDVKTIFDKARNNPFSE